MSRLVVVSNRLADPRKPAAGGLAVALGETLKKTGGLWFGWSGKVVENGTPGEGELRVNQAGSVTLAELDLSSGSGRARSELEVRRTAPDRAPALWLRGRTASGDVLVTRAAEPV